MRHVLIARIIGRPHHLLVGWAALNLCNVRGRTIGEIDTHNAVKVAIGVVSRVQSAKIMLFLPIVKR